MKKGLLILVGLIFISFASAQLTSPTTYWDLDEVAGSTQAIDNLGLKNLTVNMSSGNFTNAKLHNGFLDTSPSEGIQLNTTGGSEFAFGLGDFSFGFWINTTKSAGSYSLVSYDLTNTDGYGISQANNAMNYQFINNNLVIAETGTFTENVWHRVWFVREGTGAGQFIVYVDGVSVDTGTLSNDLTEAVTNFVFNLPNNAAKTFLDDIRIYKGYSLTTSEITTDWNNGFGLPLNNPNILLNSLTNNTFTINSSILFNSTISSTNLKNATIFIWNSSNSIINQSNKTISGNLSSSTFNVSGFTFGVYKWNVFACSTDHTCNFAELNYSFTWGVQINNNNYNVSTYETAIESFITNITVGSGSTLSSARLNWNGTYYTATTSNIGGDDWLLSKSINIPLNIFGTVNWFWELTTNSGLMFNTSTNTQNVERINLSAYGSAPQNIAYLNFTFRDEDTDVLINATIDSISFTYGLGDLSINKTLSLSNVKSQFNYGLAFSPQNRTVNVLGTIRYSNLTNYPQRIYSFDSTPFTNSTTLQTLYLLSSSTGIYSSIQTSESTGASISGVQLTVERFINSAWVIIGQQTTGSDGLSTFWVNPNYEHRITAEKEGYATATATITPSQSTYTLVMTRSTGGATYNGTLTGIVWRTYPPIGPISPGTHTFNFNLTASLNNLDGSFCKMELVNAETSSSLTSTTGGSSGGCNLTFSYTLVEDVKYRMIYSIDLEDTNGFVIIDNDAYWFTLNKNATNTLNIRSFFQDFKDLPEFGTGLRAEFSRTIAFFFILVCLLAILTFTTGYDFANPGWAMIIVLVPVAIASTVGFFQFTGLSTNTWVQKYSILLMLIFMISGFVMSYVGRNT